MPIFLSILAALLFALMGASIKLASATFGTAEVLCSRGLICMLFMWGVARYQKISLRTNSPFLHACRGILGCGAVAAWVYAFAFLPLVTANALHYTSSIWIAIFVVVYRILRRSLTSDGRENLGAWEVVVILVGFGGVLLVLEPKMVSDQLFAGLVGLASGLLAAVSYMQISTLSRAGEPPTRTVFYYAVANTVVGGVWSMFSATFPDATGAAWLWLFLTGLLASAGQWCLARAYSDAVLQRRTVLVANLQYSTLIFSALLGYSIFDDRISIAAAFGMLMIVAAAIGGSLVNTRSLSPSRPPQSR